MNDDPKQRLLILSDLWGQEKSDWIRYYTSILEEYFDIKYYDSCVLGEVDKSKYLQELLHLQFVNRGIEKAVENILKEEKNAVLLLGFSVGGYIGWKASISGLKTQHLFAISSTRLRYETEKPASRIKLVFGDEDTYKPDINWFEKLDIAMDFYPHEGHEFYKRKEVAEKICKMIIQPTSWTTE